MFCAGCGSQIQTGLNYCNSCGTQLRQEPPRSQKSLAAFLIAALAVTMIVGLLVLAGLFVALLERVANPEPVFAFGAFYLVVLLGICYLIMRQVSKVVDAELRIRDLPEQRTAPPAVQLPPRATNELDEFREPASVTDHTTRTLDGVLIDRK